MNAALSTGSQAEFDTARISLRSAWAAASQDASAILSS
jgi:hypothetical protein